MLAAAALSTPVLLGAVSVRYRVDTALVLSADASNAQVLIHAVSVPYRVFALSADDEPHPQAL